MGSASIAQASSSKHQLKLNEKVVKAFWQLERLGYGQKDAARRLKPRWGAIGLR
jgi:hypothetical protein